MKLWQRLVLFLAAGAGLFALSSCAKLPAEKLTLPPETVLSSPLSATTAPPYAPAVIVADAFALYYDEMPRGIFRNTVENPAAVEQALRLYQNAALFPVTEPETGKNLWIHMAFAQGGTDVACLSVSGGGHVLLTEGRQSAWYFGGIPLYDSLRALFLQEQYATQPFAPGFLQAEVHAFDRIKDRPDAKLANLALSTSFPVTDMHSFHLFTATLSILQNSKNKLPTAAERREETLLLPYFYNSQSDLFTLLSGAYLPEKAGLVQAKAAFAAAFFQDARYASLYAGTDPQLWLFSLWRKETTFGFAAADGEIHREMPPVAAILPADLPAYSWQRVDESDNTPETVGLVLTAADAKRALTIFPNNRILLQTLPGTGATQNIWLQGTPAEGTEMPLANWYGALRLAAFGAADKADLAPAFPAKSGEKPLDLAMDYMAFWSAHLESLPLGHLYAAADFALIDEPVINETLHVPGEKVAFSVTFAILFADGASVLPFLALEPENTVMGEGDLAGWLLIRPTITLTRGENGHWQADLFRFTDG